MTLQRILLVVGIVCLGAYIVFTVQAHYYQSQMEESFDAMVKKPAPQPKSMRTSRGSTRKGSRRAAGNSPARCFRHGARRNPVEDASAGRRPYSRNRSARRRNEHGIAAHRDSYFRPLSEIKANDMIQFRTLDKSVSYHVVETKIVGPEDTDVLNPTEGKDTLTLVTCYPFYYVGPAPKRFIVTATAD